MKNKHMCWRDAVKEMQQGCGFYRVDPEEPGCIQHPESGSVKCYMCAEAQGTLVRVIPTRVRTREEIEDEYPAAADSRSKTCSSSETLEDSLEKT